MTKNEFQKAIRSRGNMDEISDEQFAVITLVYNWHPRIPEDYGDEVIADIYCSCGMKRIADMLPLAKYMREFEERIYTIGDSLSGLQHAYEHITDMLRRESI